MVGILLTDLDCALEYARERRRKEKEVITHHTPGRTQRADRQRKEGGGRCTRPEPPGG